MNCKKCGAEINPVVAAESTKRIVAICHGSGMSEEAAHYVANLQGPLCRKCMKDWGSNEDDLKPPPP